LAGMLAPRQLRTLSRLQVRQAEAADSRDGLVRATSAVDKAEAGGAAEGQILSALAGNEHAANEGGAAAGLAARTLPVAGSSGGVGAKEPLAATAVAGAGGLTAAAGKLAADDVDGKQGAGARVSGGSSRREAAGKAAAQGDSAGGAASKAAGGGGMEEATGKWAAAADTGDVDAAVRMAELNPEGARRSLGTAEGSQTGAEPGGLLPKNRAPDDGPDYLIGSDPSEIALLDSIVDEEVRQWRRGHACIV
jgi:hypothetical protein